MTAIVETRPVGEDDLPDLARLFGSQRSTRHCWCMSCCATRRQFALGWMTGGNRERFAAMAAGSPTPMGVLATAAGEPVGWCACGPRVRYAAALDTRSTPMPDRVVTEDEHVWLLPCLFVAVGHRGRGVTRTLVRAAVDLARTGGATALESWPLAEAEDRPGEAFLGREQLFEDLGFRATSRPAASRVIMRLDLPGDPT